MRLRKSGYYVDAVKFPWKFGSKKLKNGRDGKIQRLRCVLWVDVGDLVRGTHGYAKQKCGLKWWRGREQEQEQAAGRMSGHTGVWDGLLGNC